MASITTQLESCGVKNKAAALSGNRMPDSRDQECQSALRMGQQYAVIIGAGPAGLTAALELIRTTKIRPIVLEASGEVGGISRTVCHNGNRMPAWR